MEHTKEPWATDYRKRSDGMCAQEIFDTATGVAIATVSWYPVRDGQVTSTNREENARRIVACVNACAGIPTSDLEKNPGAVLKIGVDRITSERDQLENSLRGLLAGLSRPGFPRMAVERATELLVRIEESR